MSKEVLHTQGEWKVKMYASGTTLVMGPNNEIVCKTDISISLKRAEANAELICKAVNERQGLLVLLTQIRESYWDLMSKETVKQIDAAIEGHLSGDR